MPLFKVAAEEWVDGLSGLSEKSSPLIASYVKSLSADIGDHLVCDIDLHDIVKLQRRRLAAGKSPRTVNYEVHTLRIILKHFNLWWSLGDKVRMLKGEGRPRSYTKDGRVVEMATGSVQDLIDAGVLFCGTPDQVYDQIVDFVDHCGGMGNLLMMGHAGPMSHEDTVENLTIFAREVYPRLKELRQPEPVEVAAQ